jgi:hypothetical protein
LELSANFKDLIDQQEVREVERTKVLLHLESTKNAELEEQCLLVLQMILVKQGEILQALLEECVTLTCENVEWPHDIRA